MLNSEELLDKKALEFLQVHGSEKGVLSCEWVHYNERIKLAFFLNDKKRIEERLADLTLDETCHLAQKILRRTAELETCSEISLENVVWDPDSIYLDADDQVYLLCLPAVIPPEVRMGDIYVRRLYSLLEDMISTKEDDGFICRQIEYQKEKAFGDWNSLIGTLNRRVPVNSDDANITLRSINLPQPIVFEIGHAEFRIGSDPGEADGIIEDTEKINPIQAVIGWNDISYYISDMDSETGTFVNNQRIAPRMEVPIGEGTVLRFGEYTFNVE
ncbi:MAG: FHA domain-containing protein [Eubacteriales bacterium]|nr:FHA domain-containing protein [Eubacteriales bacterium]